jgi:TonB family protein
VLLACWLAAACSVGVPQGSAPEVPGEPSPAALPDALPIYLDESEVDTPAGPLAPIQPAYPPEARLAGREGDVTLRLRVRADGQVVGIELLASDGDDFSRAATEAVRAVSFRPAVRRGAPVSSTLTILVRFQLSD